MGREQVLLLGAPERARLARVEEKRLGLLGEGDAVAQVPAADGVALARFGEALLGVLANRLEHPVARRGECFALDAEHRLVVQRRQQREHRVLVVSCGDMDGGGERTAACEHREPAKQLLLRRREMVVAPVHRRLQRLVPGQGAAAPGEEAEAVVEPGPDLVDREHGDARRGELDRQRDAVEAAADLGDGGAVARVEREPRLDQPSPVDEDPHRFRVADRRELVRRRQRQRAHRIDLLAGDAERLAAGRDQVQCRARREHRLDDGDHGVDDVLAVVEHDQQPARRHVLGQARCQRRAVDFGNAEHRGDDGDDAIAVLHRRQIDEPDAVGKGIELLARQLLRQPRLAAAADPAQRDQARGREQPGAVGAPPRGR